MSPPRRSRNPFKPTFGATPPLLVGRDALVEEFGDALEDGAGSAARATLYTGARGAGKTVMLNAIEDRAKQQGWVVISETATPGFIQRITRQRLPALLSAFDPDAITTRLTGLTGPFSTGVTWASIEQHVFEAGLRNQVELLTDLLAENETGVLITLDEIHHNQIVELREIATVIQHAFRENRELAFVGAGLASSISDVVNDKVLTFLRRAERHHLGSVSLENVQRAIREPVEAAGRTVSPEALEIMAVGTQGYPFMIQLVGARTWRLNPQNVEIAVSDAERGVADAQRRLGSLIHEPALADASAVDKSFLLAMSRDDGPSRIADICKRMDCDGNYAGQYRLRLIALELIESPRRGVVDFALPYLREYLRDHAASDM